MSFNDRDEERENILEYNYSLTLCNECDGEESTPDCLCNGTGWLVNKKGSSKKIIDNLFQKFRNGKPAQTGRFSDGYFFSRADLHKLITAFKGIEPYLKDFSNKNPNNVGVESCSQYIKDTLNKIYEEVF